MFEYTVEIIFFFKILNFLVFKFFNIKNNFFKIKNIYYFNTFLNKKQFKKNTFSTIQKN